MAEPRSFVAQPQSRLLSLPSEIRLALYDYMSLAPTLEGQAIWRGAYFTCRQLGSEMGAHLKPTIVFQAAIDQILAEKSETSPLSREDTGRPHKPLQLELRQSASVFDLVQCVTLYMPWDMSNKHRKILRRIYALFLENVRVTTSVSVTQGYLGWGPYDDLKMLGGDLFLEPLREGVINCKKITLSIKDLVDEEGGRSKTTDLALLLKPEMISYTMSIVQNKAEQQVEKVFSSPTRFRPTSS